MKTTPKLPAIVVNSDHVAAKFSTVYCAFISVSKKNNYYEYIFAQIATQLWLGLHFASTLAYANK